MMWDSWMSPSWPLLLWEWLRLQELESWKLVAKFLPSTSLFCKHQVVSYITTTNESYWWSWVASLLIHYNHNTIDMILTILKQIGANTLLLRGPKDREAKKHFGAPPGVPGSHTKPFVRSKGRKFEKGKNIWRGREAQRKRCVVLLSSHNYNYNSFSISQ